MSQTPKVTIPKALREQVWLTYAGRRYESKCMVRWCKNIMTVFDFHVGHDIPEIRGGATDISNLRPICARCNLSMGSQYTIKEWEQLSRPSGFRWSCCGV
jgi:5-methylcytosine-specific restriction endonuclease McrA